MNWKLLAELLEDNATCLKGTGIAELRSFLRAGASVSLHLTETQRVPTELLNSHREDAKCLTNVTAKMHELLQTTYSTVPYAEEY